MASPKNGKKTDGRGPDGRFTAGNKGGGRRPMPKELVEMLSGYTERSCRLLGETVADEDAKLDLRIKCAEIILDRVYGRPKQSMELEGQVDTTPPVVLSMSERAALLREVAEKFGKASNG